jgi:glycerol-3-phosphate dehydrogenase
MSPEPAPTTYDLAVIGGGVTGAGVARDAALRGLSCVLLEQGDFASGTSAKTTRLVHGGLRYLENGDLPLVIESLRERELLLHLAPHLIHPIPILLPLYRGETRKKWQLRLGLRLYDLLSLGKGTPHYGMLEPREALRRAPHLAASGLAAAGLFYDYQIPLPERLVLENVFSARDHGAACCNYREVVGIARRMDRFELQTRDRLDGSSHLVCARVVVNATGPWADRVGALHLPDLPAKLRTTKGTHLLVASDTDHAVFSGATPDQRLFFTLPLAGMTLVGTTDTPWSGDPGTAAADAADVTYLLSGLRRLFPSRSYEPDDVLWTYSGIRPLALQRGSKDPSALSRHHVLHRDGADGRFLTIVGGKYTTFRRMAEDTVDAACRLLGKPVPSSTKTTPLAGGGFGDPVLFREQLCECTGRFPDPPREVLEHLVGLYGRRCCQVMELEIENPELGGALAPGYPDRRAQVVYAVRREAARTLADVVLRRLHMGLSADRGASGAAAVSELMAAELGWDESTRRENLEEFLQQVSAETTLPEA